MESLVARAQGAWANLPQEWAWWAIVMIVAIAFLSQLYMALRLRTIYGSFRSLLSEVAEETRTSAEFQREVVNQLRAAQVFLHHIDEKLASILPPDVRVASISAENLVVGPGPTGGHGRRAA